MEAGMKTTLIRLRDALKALADPLVAERSKRFFKEPVKMYGIKTPEVTQLAKAWFRDIKDRPKAEIFALCDALWASGYHEEGLVACHWSYALRRQYEPADFATLHGWIAEHVSNWALCDTLCNHTVGTFLEMYPEFLPELKQWTRSDNRWLRRAAAVSLIVPARRGKLLPEILNIADLLLTDGDDLVQKGYGWALKAASEAQPDAVFDFVMRRKSKMPRTALRYAIEKLPPDMKARAMEK
jgi:3-methyladenine DNA glycosylase AlkD